MPPPHSHLFQLGRRVITRSTAFGLPWFHQCGFAFCFLDPLCASLLRFRACPVKAIGLPFHLRDGDDGIRTHDPLLAGQVLSQLSYTPFPFRGRVPESFPLRVGSDLSSQTVSSQVFSALQSLTTVFGMGTGGPSALLEPTSRYLSVPSVRNNRSRIELFASAFRLRLSP